MGNIEQSARVSPTAHYTGYVWARHGLGHPAFATAEGRLLFTAIRPALKLSQAFGGPTLEGLLLGGMGAALGAVLAAGARLAVEPPATPPRRVMASAPRGAGASV